MANIKIFDPYTLLTFLENGIGADYVRNLFLKAEEGAIKIAIASVNLGEVWCAIAKTTSNEVADDLIKKIGGMEIEIVNVDWPIIHQASIFMIDSNIKFTSCIAASLAKFRRGELVTGDRSLGGLEKEIRITYLN